MFTAIFGLVAFVAFLIGVYLLGTLAWKKRQASKESDQDTFRRGQDTGHLLWGTGLAIGGLLGLGAFYALCLEEVSAIEEGAIVDAPILIGSSGVQQDARFTGRHFVWPTSTMFRYSGVPINISEKFEDIPSSDNVQMDLRIHATLQIVKGASPEVHDGVGPNWYANRIQKPYRTFIRERIMAMTADQLRLNPVELKKTADDIKATLEDLIAASNVRYDVLNISIGGVTPPDEVLTESANTAAQVQRQKTEEQREKAEKTRKAAEEARAAADKAYMEKMGLNPDQFVATEGYKAYKHAADACAESGNGCTMIVGQPGVNIAVGAGPEVRR